MRNKQITSKVITGVMMASMILSTSCPVYAADTSSTTSTTTSTESNTGVPVAPPGSDTSGSSSVTTGAGAYVLSGETATLSNKEVTAADSNESIVKVTDSGKLTIASAKLTKSGGDTTSEDSSNFYGLNAGVLASGESTIDISNVSINTNAKGSNAVFATDDGSAITLNNVSIKTTSDSSRGLDATYGGSVTAKNINITTEGTHCAGFATDRGGGTITATNGAVTTNGTDSPGIYSTGTITATDCTCTANGSEAAVVEGKNSISLTNCSISGAKKRGVMLYQSTSGDAEVGTSSYTMTGGSLKAAVGPLFYVTNTDSIITLKNASLTATSGTLLTASADSWGTSGSNGGNVTFTADSETLNGNITCDSISTIAATLKNTTTLKGAINTDNTGKSVTLSLDSTSTWNVTGTSYVTSLTDSDSQLTNIKDNGNTIYYDSSVSANSWLDGKTYTLADGGKLTPQ